MILFNNNSSSHLIDLMKSSGSLNTPGSNYVPGTNPFNRSNPVMGSKEGKGFIEDSASNISSYWAPS